MPVSYSTPSLMALMRGVASRGQNRTRHCRARVSGPGTGFPCPWAAFFLAHASPDAVVLPGVQREAQALAPDGAAGADYLRLRDLVQGGTRRGDREEQFRIRMPAGGQLPPVPAGDSDHLV